MGRACSPNLKDTRGFGRQTKWKETTRRSRREWNGMDWIHLAQDWDQWQALVNMVTNLQVL